MELFSISCTLHVKSTFFFVKRFENENILFNLILLQIFFTESVCRYRYNNQFTWNSKHYLFKQIKF